MRHIGILGGSYNPPHKGHRAMAEEAHRLLGLNEVWLWVSYNIFKDPAVYAPLEDRTEMTRLLVAGNPSLKAIDIEKDFHDTMTASSLTMLQAMMPCTRFTWIFGDDNFASFHTWDQKRFTLNGQLIPDWQYIMNNFSVAVMRRPGWRDKAKNSVAADYGRGLFIDEPKGLGRAGKGWTFIDNDETPESSTGTKKSLLARQRDIPGLPRDVEDYIYNNGLFKTRDDFNGMAKPAAPPKNNVPLSTFLLLAHAASLVKAAGGQTGAMVKYATAAWDQSKASGEFGAKDQVAVKLTGCFAAFWRIVQSGAPTHSGLKDYIEQLAGLCVCENMEKDRFKNLLSFILDDPEKDSVEASLVKNNNILQEYVRKIGLTTDNAFKQNFEPGPLI